MLNFIVWIIVGGLLGWLASKILQRGATMDVIVNMIVGIVGAFVAALVLTPLFGTPVLNQNHLSIHALLVALLGAVILLTIRTFLRPSALC